MSLAQDNYVLWEPEVSHRGTFSILVTCFTMLGICVWSALHLSIPGKKRSWRKSLGVRLLWMTIGLLLPELLILAATKQRWRAAELRDKVNAHFNLVGIQRPWYQRWFHWPSTAIEHKDEERLLVVQNSSGPSDTSSIQSGDDKSQTDAEPANANETPAKKLELALPFPKNKLGRHRWTLVHAFYAEMGGFAIYNNDNKLQVLHGQFIEELLERNAELVPDLPEDTILDKSKADGLAKALLFTQVGWFCVSCVNRLVQRFPLTLLEVTTLAHALCSMMVYILWWDKPLNIQQPTIIANPGMLRDQERLLRSENCLSIEFTDDDEWVFSIIVLISISLVYGAPHLLAWDSAFVTQSEQQLWRVASCVVTGSPILFIVFGWIDDRFLGVLLPFAVERALVAIICISLPLVYFPANLYLIAESIRQLFHLPSAAFQTPIWSNYFPHLS